MAAGKSTPDVLGKKLLDNHTKVWYNRWEYHDNTIHRTQRGKIMLYNICVYPIIYTAYGTREGYACQMWGDRLEIDHRSYLDVWMLYMGDEIVSVGDVRDLHAYKKDGQTVMMKYSPRV